MCSLAGSAATEKRFTAESTGRLLQGATGTVGEKGTRRIHRHIQKRAKNTL